MASNKVNIWFDFFLSDIRISQCHENGCKLYKSQFLVWKHVFCVIIWKRKSDNKGLQKFMRFVKIKTSKSISNLLMKTGNNNNFDILIQFDSYKWEADPQENKNVLTPESQTTQHTILQQLWL